MNSLIVPLSLMCGLVLCATAVSVFAAYRAYRLLVEIDSRARQPKDKSSEQPHDLAPLRHSLEALSSQVRDLQLHPVPPPSGAPRSSFNLSKRSQALRMHRRGEAPEQIAASLDLPRQEVELLLKVHRIVIQNV
jgi:hypothetical protein